MSPSLSGCPAPPLAAAGLPDGYYLLDTVADADGLVLEANETNNVNTTLVRICGDAADIVGEGTSCPANATRHGAGQTTNSIEDRQGRYPNVIR